MKFLKEVSFVSISILVLFTSFFYLNNVFMQVFSIFLFTYIASDIYEMFSLFMTNKVKHNYKYFWIYLSIRALRLPIKILFWIIAFIIEFNLLATHITSFNQYHDVVDNLYHYSLIFIITWSLFRFSNRFKEYVVNEFKNKTSKIKDDAEKTFQNKYKTTTIDASFKVLNVTIFIMALIAVIQKMGFPLSGLLAFGGMSGIIVGMGARDLLSNLFGGIMVYFNRPFDIGDWICSPDREIEGIVEDIGWFVTKVRKFDRRPLYLPNAVFTTISVENPSRMSHRRIKETFRVSINDFDKITQITRNIKLMLQEHNGIDDKETLIVNLDHIKESYLEIMVYCFTKTILWENYHSIKQDVFLRIGKIVSDSGTSIALNKQDIIITRPKNFDKNEEL
jgi:MscS family membrane protein